MLKQATIVAGSAAGLVTLAPVANAEDGGGINVANDNMIVAPIQMCGVTVDVGTIMEISSPQVNNCVNAPLTDRRRPSTTTEVPVAGTAWR